MTENKSYEFVTNEVVPLSWFTENGFELVHASNVLSKDVGYTYYYRYKVKDGFPSGVI